MSYVLGQVHHLYTQAPLPPMRKYLLLYLLLAEEDCEISGKKFIEQGGRRQAITRLQCVFAAERSVLGPSTINFMI